MKANELMIGNWVTGKKWKELPFKITHINDSGKYYYGITAEGSRVGPFLIEELQPIPLTPELLEKNGFSQDPLNGHIFIFQEKSGEVIYYEYGPKYGLTIDNQFATIQDLKIKYVHELQHALRLCKIEKEIEL